MKKGDVVWINEVTLGGKPLRHEWYGEIMKIEGELVTIKDNTGGDYNGERFERLLCNLELKQAI